MSPPDSNSEREQHAYERARPVFQKYCASCHTSSTSDGPALQHFNMDQHPFGGHHADQIAMTVRKVLGATGQAPTMPRDRPGAVQGEELRLILAWAAAFDRAQPTAPTHHDGGHAH